MILATKIHEYNFDAKRNKFSPSYCLVGWLYWTVIHWNISKQEWGKKGEKKHRREGFKMYEKEKMRKKWGKKFMIKPDKDCMFSRSVWLFAAPWTVACQSPPSMAFSRQEYWSEWVAISFSRGSSRPRNWTRVSCIAGRFFTDWAAWEAVSIYDSKSSNFSTNN